MANYQLFIPRCTQFFANTIAGAGQVLQWTYTVPTGKRAVLQSIHTRINGNGAAAGQAATQAIITLSAVPVELVYMDASGIANASALNLAYAIDMVSGDTLQGYTLNFSVVNIFMAIGYVIQEFQ